MPTETVPIQPAALTANLHVEPGHVTAVSLRPRGDLVSLRLGDDNASVAVLGTKGHVLLVLNTAVAALEQL